MARPSHRIGHRHRRRVGLRATHEGAESPILDFSEIGSVAASIFREIVAIAAVMEVEARQFCLGSGQATRQRPWAPVQGKQSRIRMEHLGRNGVHFALTRQT